MTTILLTGRDGQVGWELQRTLAPLGQVIALDRKTLDLTDANSIRSTIQSIRPDIIVNAAAYTAVDQAETNVSVADAINARAPGVMAHEAQQLHAWLIHYSTDYVFDGQSSTPYLENDIPRPLNVYGRGKLAGERAILDATEHSTILRTSWVYGLRGKNFLRTILKLAQEKQELRIVADQIGAPTWSRLIAEATAALIAHAQYTEPDIIRQERSDHRSSAGIFHLTCAGSTSWYGFTQEILNQTHALRSHQPSIIPIPSSDYPLPAMRPQNSTLSCERLAKTTGIQLPNWRDALTLCLAT